MFRVHPLQPQTLPPSFALLPVLHPLPLLLLPLYPLPLKALCPLLMILRHVLSQKVSLTDQPSDDASLYHNANIYLVTSLLLIMSFILKHILTDAAQIILCS